MKTRCYIKALIFLAMMLALPLAAMAADSSAQDDNATLQLGKVEVHGQQNIVQVLQDIKVGLRQPYSTDPKMANVTVCRLVPQAGSHIMDHLICGTNRALAGQRFALQTGMAVAESGQPACDMSCVMEHIFTQLNEYLQNLPQHGFQADVNGATLRSVLAKIPDPDSAAEVMQLGTLTIHGQADIMQTLQAVKLALQQPRSNDPKLADVVVCRFHTISGSATDEMLDCAANRAFSKQTAVVSSSQAIPVSAIPTGETAQAQVTVLNSMLTNAPGNELQAKVDGVALRALLKEIPYPTPATSATSAPTASTQH
ncbi:MAG: hypothetical protein WCC11_11915 [Gammaproteobacteria bacterium]